MNILVVSQFFYPDDFRINDIAKELAADGHHVEVLTGLPDYATSRIPSEYRFFRKRKETVDGVHITRVPTIARRRGILFRMLNYLSFVISGCLYARFCKFRADVVLSCETSPVLQVMPAITYKKRRHVPLVIYCCDIWPECLKVWGVKESSLLFRLMHKRSNRIFQSGDVVPYSSLPFHAYLRDVNGMPEDKLVYLPQHAEDMFCPNASGVGDGRVHFGFAGNIGAAQQVDCLVRAAALLPTDKPFMVHIFGDGSERENCERLAEELGVTERVVFRGKFPVTAMPRLYSELDCFILTMMGGGVGSATLPAKMQGYISAGKPVLAAADGASADFISQVDCGLSVPAGDSEGLAQAMLQVIDDPAAFRRKGENGRRYYEENFTKDIFMKRLYAILDKVIRHTKESQ